MPISLTELSRSRLSNGLEVLLLEDHSVPIVSTMLWYRVGSRHEPAGQSGLAHFLEHMMFRGTAHLSDGAIDLLTTLNGGQNNAFTSFDCTAYYFSFASYRWPVGLEIEADRMQHALLDGDLFEIERQVILEELLMTRDNPWEALRQAVDEAGFLPHPYGRPVIGMSSDIASILPAQMEAFYHRYYRPVNAVLLAVGDFRTADAEREIERHFGPIPASSGADYPVEPIQPPSTRQPGRLVIEQPTHVSRLLFAFPAPPFAHPDGPVIDLLDSVLSGGKLSRLYSRLVDREQLVSLVHTDLEETVDPYHYFIQLELNEGSPVAQVEEIIAQELDLLRREPVDEKELSRVRNHCLSRYLEDLETTFDRAFQLGLHEVLETGIQVSDYHASLQSVTADALLEAANRYLDPGQAIVAISPVKG